MGAYWHFTKYYSEVSIRPQKKISTDNQIERTSCEAKRTDCEVMTNERKVVRQETGGTPGK